jgi:aspartate-semialdehyde dehydrogenase
MEGSVTLIGVPVFSGISAEIRVETEDVVEADKVAQVLSKGGCQVVAPGARALPRPRKVEGQPLIHVGRIRNAPNGRGIHVWASADNLAGVATVMVSGCRALLKSAGKP